MKKQNKAQRRAQELVKERLFDLRTRIADIGGRDPDLLTYGIRRYRQPEKRAHLLKRIQAVRTTLGELSI